MKSAATASAAQAPWTQLASGTALPLNRVLGAGALDLRRDIAIPLGILARYAGQMPNGVGYCVAQHCCIGADFLYAQEREPAPALAFLLHDAHEAVIGDFIHPVTEALQELLDELRLRAGGDLVPRISIARLKAQLAEPIDRLLHAEAGLPWPLPPRLRRLVAEIDARLLVTERDHMLATPAKPWAAELETLARLPLRKRIAPLRPALASEMWLDRYERWTRELAERALAPTLPALAEQLKDATR